MLQKLKNALAIIKQIKNNEWEFKGHYPYEFRSYFKCYTAERKGVVLWVANGALACGIRDRYWDMGFFGVLVWFFAARKKVKELERIKKRKPHDLTA